MRMTDNKQNEWAEYMVYYTVTSAKKENKAKKKMCLDIRGGDCNFIWGGHRRFNHLSYRLKKREGSSNVDIQRQSTPCRVEVEACGLGEGPGGGWVDDTGEVTQGSEPRALEVIARTWAFPQRCRPGYRGVFIQGKTFMLTSSFSGYVVKEGDVGSKEINYMTIKIMQPRCDGPFFRLYC